MISWLTMKSLILSFAALSWCSLGVDIDCSNAYECSFSSLSTIITQYELAEIRCNGYHACTKAIDINGVGEVDIECYGSFSCYQATKISIYRNGNYDSGWVQCMTCIRNYVYIYIYSLNFQL